MLELDKIHLGDSYELIKQIPDKSIDLVCIDPPYEYTTCSGGGCFGTDKRSYHAEINAIAFDMSDLDGRKTKSRSELRQISSGFDYKLLGELDRVMKKINIYIWCSKHQVRELLEHYQDLDCNTEILTWHKTNPLPAANNTYLNDTEYCIFSREVGVPLGGTIETKKKFWVTSTNTDDKDHFEHPTIKPLQIIKNLIFNSSNEGDTVLDCFSGSGTTCVAAKELGRHFIGIEIDPRYHKISVDRLNGISTNGQTSIFTDFEKVSK